MSASGMSEAVRRKDARMHNIVCFGEALIDFLARPGEDADAPRTFTQYAGGAPANVAVAVARLGGRSEFVGMFGEDMFGDFLLDSLARHGVGTRHALRTAEAKTALAFVALDGNGERSFSFYRPPAADLLFRPEHFSDGCFADAAIFHVCSNSLTEEAIAQTTLHGMAQARECGALVSIDLNLRPSLWQSHVDPLPRLWRALEQADLVKLARNELDYLAADAGGEEAVYSRLQVARARLVVVTDGSGPLQWRTSEHRGCLPAFVVRAIDTTAAGDAFVGGLLYLLAARGVTPANIDALLCDEAELTPLLRFAAACGALTVTQHGAFAAMPTLAEVQALFETTPVLSRTE